MDNIKEKEVFKVLLEERKEIINTINCMNKYMIYEIEKLEKENNNDTKRN